MTNSIKLQFYHHVRSLSRIIARGEYSPAIAAETLLVLWTRRERPSLNRRGLLFSKSLAEETKVIAFVDWLSGQNLENTAYWLSSAYSMWADEEYRKSLAMFFTPPSLATRLLDDLENVGVSFANASFFDPACGGAAFLTPIAQRIRAVLKKQGKSPTQILRHIEERLFGADLDQTLCRLSKHFLRIVLSEEILKTGIEPKIHITTSNSLKGLKTLHGTIDVVVCNPPYRKMPSGEVVLYREDFPEVIEQQPNLYGLFISLCLRLLKPAGVAAMVTPTSFMSGQYFSKLRCYLMENSEIIQIGIVGDKLGVFINVEQETALTLLKRKAPKHVSGITTKVAIVTRDGQFNSVGRCFLPNSGTSWPIPRSEGDVELIGLLNRSKYRLTDYGYSPRIGAFVWNRDSRRTFFSMADAKKARATAAVPLLWSRDIGADGLVRFSKSPKENNEPSFIDVIDKTHPSIVRRPALMLQRVTSNDQSLRLVVATVPPEIFQSFGGFVGENHTVILEAQEECPAVPPEVLAQLLRSYAVDRYFRCISGATNVSIFELLQLPLPSPTRVRQFLESGLSINVAIMDAYREEI